MEDENGLELSLGLSVGGSSSKFKARDTPSDPKGDEGSSNRLMGGNVSFSDDTFKNFFKSGLENQESKGKQKSEIITPPQENFFTDLAKCLVKCPASMTDCSNDARNNPAQFARYQERLILSNRSIDSEEEKSGSSKRKLSFEDISFQNKHEKLVDFGEKLGVRKSSGAPSLRNSHVSNATEDGSTGDNEDVAESEAEGLQPWLVSQRDENAKSSDALKFSGKSVLSDLSGIVSQGLREPSLLRKEANPEYGKSAVGLPLSLQQLKAMNVPYPVPVTVPSTSSGFNAAGFPSAQLAFGYLSSQLPMLEMGSSWAFNSQPLNASPFPSRQQSTGIQIHEHFEDGVKTNQGAIPHHTIPNFSYGKAPDFVFSGTRHVGEAVLSARPEDQARARTSSMHPTEAITRLTAEAFSREAPAIIRPGVAPSLRFGGSGSFPDLPWVTTTGQGPNGRTISGVTYKCQNQIKIVCACHGTHMSPEEFVQHANSEVPNSENNPNLASFTTTNTTNSAAQS